MAGVAEQVRLPALHVQNRGWTAGTRGQGSFQHIGGIKGSPLVVAINKDAAAPIFGAADIGIVGDLLEVVPALEDAIRKVKG